MPIWRDEGPANAGTAAAGERLRKQVTKPAGLALGDLVENYVGVDALPKPEAITDDELSQIEDNLEAAGTCPAPPHPDAQDRELYGLLVNTMLLADCFKSAHWTCAGQQFYADHLMYDRCYDEVYGFIDKLAEALVKQAGSQKAEAMLNTSALQFARSSILSENLANEGSIVYAEPSPAGHALACSRSVMCVLTSISRVSGLSISQGVRNTLDELCARLDTCLFLLNSRVSSLS